MSHATAADGTRIRYDVLGEGDPLLLFNGQSLDLGMWDGLRAEFARAHRVVRMDFRGTGGSDAPLEPPYTLDLFARDALAVLDELGIERTHVYGFSMGGKVAQAFAHAAPDRLGALVLGSTAPGGEHEVPRPHSSTVALRRAATREGRGVMAELFYTREWAEANPGTVANILPRRSMRAMRLHFEASSGHDGWGMLPGIEAPTLVVHGEDDQLTPVANAELIADRVPGAELLTLPGLRHGYPHEGHPKATEAVLDFLARHPLGRG